MLAVKFASKSATQAEINGVLVTPEKTVATDRYTLLEVENPKDFTLEDFPKVPNNETAEITTHIMPLESAKLLEANLKKVKNSSLPVLQNAAGLKLEAENQAGFVTTNLESATPIIYQKIDGEFPDYQQIVPKEKSVIEFNVSPEFLKRIAETYQAIGNASVNVKYYGDNQPLVFEAKTCFNQNVKALLMLIKS